MEIMVVVIVIAVLASVAGPMLTEITDSGRVSATRARLSALRTALQAYSRDIGHMPFYSDTRDKKISIETAEEELLASDPALLNVLVSPASHDGEASATKNVTKITGYDKLWKGPYMDGDPSNFMVDAWENPIRYRAHGNSIYLWSRGTDVEFGVLASETGQPDANVLAPDYTGGNIVLSVFRQKEAFQ